MKTRVTELLGIEAPIIQGGMARVADASLAAAVSEAGGLGIIACGGAKLDWIAEQVKQAKAQTDKPFGCNIMLMDPLTPEIAKLVVELDVKVVTTGAGSPTEYLSMWREAGIKVIQIDEAALREKLPLRKTDWHKKYLDWAIPAFRLVHSAVKPTTQIHTHMCYSEFNDIIKDIDAMDADVISFEASRGDLVVLDAIHDANFETEAGPGVYDIHSPRIPSEQEIKDRIYEILKKMDVEKVWINPDCGLKTRGNAETWPSLENLVTAAKAVRAKLAK